MKNKYPRIAALAIMASTLSGGCDKSDCLNQSYDATIKLIRDFNDGRCVAVIGDDHRAFNCPSGRLEGEVNGRIFDLKMNTHALHYQFTQNKLEARCGYSSAEISDSSVVLEVQRRFKDALAGMEVD